MKCIIYCTCINKVDLDSTWNWEYNCLSVDDLLASSFKYLSLIDGAWSGLTRKRYSDDQVSTLCKKCMFVNWLKHTLHLCKKFIYSFSHRPLLWWAEYYLSTDVWHDPWFTGRYIDIWVCWYIQRISFISFK